MNAALEQHLTVSVLAMVSGAPVAQEAPVKTSDGVRLWLSRRVAIKDDAGNAQYVIQTSEDITDRRQSESREAH